MAKDRVWEKCKQGLLTIRAEIMIAVWNRIYLRRSSTTKAATTGTADQSSELINDGEGQHCDDVA